MRVRQRESPRETVEPKEFVSEVEKIRGCEELLFDATAGLKYGYYDNYFPADSVKHPAKMNLRLLEFLILQHTKKGDVVLDPMSGTGSTGVVSSLNGRDAVCVELEVLKVGLDILGESWTEKRGNLKQ